VLVIDDLQWMDRDSASIIDNLFINAPPRLLLLGTARESTQLDGAEAIALSALDTDACRQLTRAILGDDPRVERIATESRGDPLLVETLCRDLREHGDLAGDTSLDAAVSRRLSRLSPQVRRLFELIACAGRPIESTLLNRAANEEANGVALAELCSRRLLKVRSAQGATFVEAAHDRVRDVALSRLPSYARRVHHAALAEALEEVRGASPELLAVHWQAAGHDAHASEQLVRAAAAAQRVSALDRAARLYRQAIALATRSRTTALFVQLGEVLERNGTPRDAGEAFLSAAELLGGDDARELKARGEALRSQPS
jgi:predicted ATPase